MLYQKLGVCIMKTIKIALLGFGVVASGVYEILSRGDLAAKSSVKVEIAKILVRDLNKYNADVQSLMTLDYNEILADDSIDIVVELTGTADKNYITKALKAGKSVVTANKYLVARNYDEFTSLAKNNDVYFYYEAAVGGGIPLILGLNQGLIANEITAFYGILNGTCNYILTEMADKGLSYDKALTQAKELGYAEADESADVLGHDTLNKLLILTRLAFGQSLAFDDVYCKGINEITTDDIARASEKNCVIKLLAVAERKEQGLMLAVYPAFVPKTELLAQVHSAYNALLVKGDAVGDVMFYGQGAGSLPTASAVVSDIMAVALANDNQLAQENKNIFKLLEFQSNDLRYKEC